MKLPAPNTAIPEIWKEYGSKHKAATALSELLYFGGCKPTQVNLTLFHLLTNRPWEEIIPEWFEAIDEFCLHPDYEWWFEGKEEDPGFIPFMGVFEHEPGKFKRTESYVFGTLGSILSQVEWAERTLGVFTGLKPVPYDWILESTPLIKFRHCYISYSYKGGGRAYASRMQLKALLPAKLRPAIQKTRTRLNQPKYQYLYEFFPEEEYAQAKDKLARGYFRKIRNQPPKYAQATKIELIARFFIEVDYPKMADYIDPVEFVRCAAGKYHPDDVHRYIHHQTVFDITSEVPVRPKKKREKHEKPEPAKVNVEQLSFE